MMVAGLQPFVTLISRQGGAMKITVWLVTRTRETWITSAEVLVLALVLYTGPGAIIRLLIGLPALVHVGYTALTGLPMRMIPGRPIGVKLERRNQDLRSSIVGFLNEVRRAEDSAQRAMVEGRPTKEVDLYRQTVGKRVMAAAAEVVKATGRAED
jgi:hypothetical protein